MIKLVQIRDDKDVLFSGSSVNDAFDYVDGLFTCHHARENSTKIVDMTPYWIDFLIDYYVPCNDSFEIQFSLKLNFKMSKYDINRFLIDFVKPYLN